MNRFTASVFSLAAAALLSACATTTYVPSLKDVTEEPISDNYWYQRFTLYTPASSATDCPISRTGQRIDLNSPAQVADAWRQFCRTTSDNPSRSDSR